MHTYNVTFIFARLYFRLAGLFFRLSLRIYNVTRGNASLSQSGLYAATGASGQIPMRRHAQPSAEVIKSF
jgi:hypothetical protein